MNKYYYSDGKKKLLISKENEFNDGFGCHQSLADEYSSLIDN